MRVALIGEQSGVHLSLAKAFRKLKLDVRLYSSGDGFKRIPGDAPLPVLPAGVAAQARFYAYEMPTFAKNLAGQFDVVQLINPHILPTMRSGLYTAAAMRMMCSEGAKVSLLAVGCDSRTQNGLSGMLRSPCRGCLADYGASRCPFIVKGRPAVNQAVEDAAAVVFTMGGASYASSYSSHDNVQPPMPLPVDPETCEGPRPPKSGPIRVFHGISRRGFKGTEIILKAFEIAASVLGDEVDISTSEGLPYSEYLERLSAADIVVDQLYGDGLGMNSLQAMAAGCVVLTAFEKRDFGSVHYSIAPAINIGTDSAAIADQLCELVAGGRPALSEIQDASRKYVSRYHDVNTSARTMLDTWIAAGVNSSAVNAG